ncbi:hypothetical protein D3C86_1717140 [compost metagenome]
MDDLIYRVPQFEQFLAMGRGGHPHLGQCLGVTARGTGDPDAFRRSVVFLRGKRTDQLIEEQRNAVGQLLLRCRTPRPSSDF